jgi:hypothetical protein
MRKSDFLRLLVQVENIKNPAKIKSWKSKIAMQDTQIYGLSNPEMMTKNRTGKK